MRAVALEYNWDLLKNMATLVLTRLAMAIVWLTVVYLLTKEFKSSSSEKQQTWRISGTASNITRCMQQSKWKRRKKLNEPFLSCVGCYGVADGRSWRWYVREDLKRIPEASACDSLRVAQFATYLRSNYAHYTPIRLAPIISIIQL